MKYRTSLIAFALFALAFAGCSKHSQTGVAPKVTDLGTIEVADGKSSSHVLADGRTCVLTPTVLPGGHQIQLEMSISNTNAAGTRSVYSLTSYFNPEQTTSFIFDSNNIISLTLHRP
jgi:hypothetical protein